MLVGVVKVVKSGGSLVLTIPKEAAASLGLKPGTRMAVRVEGGRLIYEPVEGEVE